MKPPRRAARLIRPAAFTLGVHALLLTLLLHTFTWSKPPSPRGAPVAAVTVAAAEVDAYFEQKEKEVARAAAAHAEKLRKQEAEKRARIAREKQRIAEAQKQKQLAAKRAAEEERKRKLAEQRKAEEERRRKLAEQRKAEEERQRKLAEQRAAEAERKRKLAEQRAANRRNAEAAIEALVARIREKVTDNWRRPSASRNSLSALIKVRVARDGRVLSAVVIRSSGDPFFDQSAERAVQKASPLPFPPQPEYYEFIHTFDLQFSPDEP